MFNLDRWHYGRVKIALLLALALAAPKPSLPAAERTCFKKTDRYTVVRFKTADGQTLRGAVLGSGGKWVVLGHQWRSSLCEWVPFARVLAKNGFHVLAFDLRNNLFSPNSRDVVSSHVDVDMAAAASYARSRGAARVGILGASMSATGALASGADVDAIVSLSPPREFGPANALAAAPSITAPTLIVAAENDGEIGNDAKAVYDAIPATTDKRLELVTGSAHGVVLVTGISGARVRALVIAFLRSALA
jgi:pimeloyl-ACP methyl ester carboxylesterase